jgi:hypothetical protein
MHVLLTRNETRIFERSLVNIIHPISSRQRMPFRLKISLDDRGLRIGADMDRFLSRIHEGLSASNGTIHASIVAVCIEPYTYSLHASLVPSSHYAQLIGGTRRAVFTFHNNRTRHRARRRKRQTSRAVEEPLNSLSAWITQVEDDIWSAKTVASWFKSLLQFRL